MLHPPLASGNRGGHGDESFDELRRSSHMAIRNRREPKKRSGPNREKTSRPRRALAPASRAEPEPALRESGTGPVSIVGIGASAGGLEAVTALLRALPADTGMAFVLVQHLDPTHASMLTEILSRTTSMPLVEAGEGMTVEADHVYVIPPAATLSVSKGVLHVIPRGDAQLPRRAIDLFLQSLAEDQGSRAVGVVLSGSGSDGTAGMGLIRAEGGITIAQDQSAQHASMPASAAATGSVDFVLPPARIAAELVRISRHPYVRHPIDDASRLPGAGSSLTRVLEQLRLATGVDFSSYKRNTLFRRVTRRAVLHKMEDLRDYARLLQSSPAEIEALYQDVLINVTTFFRNPEAFEVLKTKVFPRLVRDRSRHDPLRVWSIGCSTGEEAYSLAMAYVEFAESARVQVPLQVFASDLNGAGVEKARAGVYSRAIAHDVSPERLRRFFFEHEGTYRISKVIRDTVVFARHNVLTEPPFSRIDLVSCRNLLIYLETSLQQKAIGVMHYALKPHGVLWLGASETVAGHRDLFDLEDAKFKMYVKKPGRPRVPRSIPTDAPARRTESPGIEPEPAPTDVQREADRLLLARFTPASVLVTDDMEILQFRGETGLYLTPAPGKASLNLLKMLRDGLLVGVRGALLKARREEAPVREDGLRVRRNGGFRHVDVHVLPMRSPEPGARPHFLVLFEEASSPESARRPAEKSSRRRGRLQEVAARRAAEATERETARLAQELAATREYLQSVIERQEAANEELQSSNEEVQSANEELQSVNEELETSKEEVESANEELATVNEELQNRNAELGQSNNDFVNLLASVQLPIVMLGSDLRIRRFTPMAETVLNLIGTDVGRPISDIQLGLGIPDLERILVEVIETVAVREIEVRDKQGHWYVLRVRPYRTNEDRIEGALVVLIDVDAIKRDQETLRRQAALLERVSEPIFMWNLNDGITYWNQGAAETYGFTREQALRRPPDELLATAPISPGYMEALQTRGHWTGELTRTRADGAQIMVESRMIIERAGDGPTLVFESNHPITERKQMEQSLRAQTDALLAADRSKDEFLAILAHELRNPLAPLANALELLKNPATAVEVQDRARQIMTHQIWNMARLVDDLLDVARITQGRIHLRKEVRDVAEIVRQAVEAIRHQFDSREQHLEATLPSGPVLADVDPLRLEQVVSNLLSNASKFSPHGGRIEVSVIDHADRDGQIEIRVKDNGVGISTKALARVFDLFMQEESSIARTTGGLGIGLTLVRHLVGLHGGSVEALSEGPGRGSEFVVRLPAGPRRSEESRPVEVAVTTGAGRRIMVVDDNLDGAEAMGIVLRMAGHEVHTANSAAEALGLARALKPEVIFLDLGMPDMDGFEAAQQLRRLRELDGTLLVAMTGYGQESARQRAGQVGFDEYIVKPAQPDVVRALALKVRPT